MIRIDNLKKYFGTKPILEEVSYHFPEGERIALVGANGAGKTTLLNVLTSVEELDGGSILKPPRLRLGYLPQEPNPRPADTVLEEAVAGGEGYMQVLYRAHRDALHAMSVEYSDKTHQNFERIDFDFNREGGYAMESDAKAVLGGLGFSPETIESNPSSLSGGWRMRLELAKIFINKPNFLILDEPTNHLDLPSLIWVERWLQSYQGTLLFVSHDRSLLDRLPTMTIHLHLGKMNVYKGNFTSFLEQRELRLQQDASTADALRRRREHLQSFVDRFGAKATKAAQAQSRVKMIARIREMESTVPSDDAPDSIALKIPMSTPSGREVLKIIDGAVGYQKVLSKGIQLLVEKGQRIAVIGANGIGKSTLLKTIAGVLKAKEGSFTVGYNVSLGWFAQDQLDSLDLNKDLMYNVLQASAETSEREARSLLGSLLFRGEDVFKKVGVLSGGEKARVGLAKLLAQRANFLVMDEPTNHLDLSSVEILVEALQEYAGTLLFVSHDRNFIDAVCTHVFVMLPDGRSQVFVGKLEDYQRLAKVSGFPDVLDPSPINGPSNSKSNSIKDGPITKPNSDKPHVYTESEISSLRKQLQKSERRLTEIDSSIAMNQSILTRIDEQISASSSDFSLIASLSKEREDVALKQVKLEEEWLAVSEDAENQKAILKSIGRI